MNKNNDHVISRYGERGWKFTLRNSAGFGFTYRTTGTGDGLFRLRVDPNGGERWEQVQGTSQYSLPSNRAAAIRKLNQNNGESWLAREDELYTLEGSF